METLTQVVGIVGYAIEVVGVLIIASAGVYTALRFVVQWRHEGGEPAYRGFRTGFGRALIVGLEFLIAGDIIRTVVVSHTLTSVAVLAVIVLIRAFLSFTLELGIEGRIPWRPSHGARSD